MGFRRSLVRIQSPRLIARLGVTTSYVEPSFRRPAGDCRELHGYLQRKEEPPAVATAEGRKRPSGSLWCDWRVFHAEAVEALVSRVQRHLVRRVNGAAGPARQGQGQREGRGRASLLQADGRRAPGQPPEPPTPASSPSCDLFLDHSQQHNKPPTLRAGTSTSCRTSATSTARCWCADLKPFHVTRWLDAHPGWKGTRRRRRHRRQAGLQLGRRRGAASPPTRSRRSRSRRCGRRDRILTPRGAAEDPRQLPRGRLRSATSSSPWRRPAAGPGEVAEVTADHVNLELGVWVFDEHKTAEQDPASRGSSYLTPAMVELTRRLMASCARRPAVPRTRTASPGTATPSAAASAASAEKLGLGGDSSPTSTATPSPPTCWSPAPASPRPRRSSGTRAPR